MTWNVPGSRRPARKSFQPACEPLEDRNLLSSFNLSSLTTGILPVLDGTMPPITLTPPTALPPGALVLPPIQWIGDESGNVIVSKDMLQVTPGGDADSYTLVLSSQPTADVTITVNQGDPRVCALMALASPINSPIADSAPLVITPITLTFTSDNWNVPQTVKVSAPATVDSSTPFVLLSHSVNSDDPNYSGTFVPDVFVQVGNITPPIPPPIQTGGVEVSTDKLELTPGGPAQTYTLVLTSQPTADVTITVSQGNPEMVAMGAASFRPGFGNPVPLTITPTTLTFTADNWNVAQTISVSAPASPTDDEAQFTFMFHHVSSDDPNYNDLFVPSVFVKVGDFTPPIPPPIQTGGVEVSTNRLEVTTGGPAETYTVVLTSQPTADVTINIAEESIGFDPLLAAANTITTSSPLVVTPTTLTFTHDNWDQPQTVTVSLPAGAATDEHFAVLKQTVTSDDPNYNGILVPSVFVHIADDSMVDRPGLVVSTHHLAVTAGDETGATYTLALATKPTADVTVTIQDSFSLLGSALGRALPPGISLGSITVTPQTLTFTPDNWNVAQTVTVTAPAPSGEFSIPFAVLFNTLKSDDPNYDNFFTQPVFVAIHGLTPPMPVPPVPLPIPEPPFPGPPFNVPPIEIQPFPLPLVHVGATPPAQALPPANGDGPVEHTATNHHKKTQTSGNALTRRRRSRRNHSNKGLSS
jgi:hypothetical protein